MSNFSLPSPPRLAFAVLLLFAFHAPAAVADTGPWALFDGSPAISEPDAEDSINVELGVRFTVDAPASGAHWLTKVRYWRAPNRPINTNRVNVYDSSGTQVARGSYDVDTGAGGTVDVPLATPLRLAPGKTYTVSYSAPTGHYALDRGAFASARTVGPVHFPPNAGVYQYGGGYPTSSWQSTSYYVTPIVTLDASTPPEAAPADDGTGPWSLLTDSTEIVERVADDPNRVEVGVRFKVDAPATGAYVVKAVRFFRGRSMPENYVYIYDDDRKVVARGQFLTEGGPSDVVEVKLSTPLALRPGVEYTASYLATYGYYADEPHGFDEGRTVGPVRFPPNAGVYQYGGGFPGDSWASSGYYVSPVVSLDETASSPAEPPSTGPWSLFDGSTTIADPAADDSAPVEVGVRFSVPQPPEGAYTVRAVRFYRAPLHPMVENRVFVYDEDGTLAARGVAIGEGGPSGVVDVLLNAPLQLTPGRTYTASYVAVDGHYAVDRGAFTSSRTKGPLRFPADAGVYQYGGGFPTSSWQSTGYYVSPIVALDTTPLAT